MQLCKTTPLNHLINPVLSMTNSFACKLSPVIKLRVHCLMLNTSISAREQNFYTMRYIRNKQMGISGDCLPLLNQFLFCHPELHHNSYVKKRDHWGGSFGAGAGARCMRTCSQLVAAAAQMIRASMNFQRNTHTCNPSAHVGGPCGPWPSF